MADTIATTWIEPTTGLKIPILLGPTSRVFDQWMKDIKLVAESKDLWSLISPESFAKADREKILSKPVKPDVPEPFNDYRYGATQRSDEKNYGHKCNVYNVEITEYKLALTEWEKQQKRLREARTLLLATATSYVRDSINDKALPHEIMAEVKAYCGPSEIYRSSDATQRQTSSSTTPKLTSATPPSPTFSTNSSIWSAATLKN